MIPGHEDPLEKEMETHSSILAWSIPWTEEPGGLQVLVIPQGHTRLRDLITRTGTLCVSGLTSTRFQRRCVWQR